MRKEQIATKVACLGCFATAAIVILFMDNIVLSLVLICLCGCCATLCRNNTEQIAAGWIIVLRETLLLCAATLTVQIVAFAMELKFNGQQAEIIVGSTMALWVAGTVISGVHLDRVLTEAFGDVPDEEPDDQQSTTPGP